jgi:DNA polymerase
MKTSKPVLHLDFETRSEVNLKYGVSAYTEGQQFEVLLIAAAFGEEKVVTYDVSEGQPWPEIIRQCLLDDSYPKRAFNTRFERCCASRALGRHLSPAAWYDTQADALRAGLPASLAQVAQVLHLPQQKDPEGERLIRLFSCPHGDLFASTFDYPDDYRRFSRYCAQDVYTERCIHHALQKIVPFNPIEHDIETLSHRINDYGIRIDSLFARKAMMLNNLCRQEALEQLRKQTGMSNPNSVMQLKNFIYERTGEPITSLNKAKVKALIAAYPHDDILQTVLHARLMIGKTSTQKYAAMLHSVCADGRLRDTLRYYGASRTGRWASGNVQVHNLPRNTLPHLMELRQEIMEDDLISVVERMPRLSVVLSQLIRTAFVAPRGKTFVIVDFSAIEARVLSWLARERWRMEVFAHDGKIYEMAATRMFGIPIKQVTKDSPWRAMAKVAELALGYQGAVGALSRMSAGQIELSEIEMCRLVKMWRKQNPSIVRLWYDIEIAALQAVSQQCLYTLPCGLQFDARAGWLVVTLPSGRSIYYPEVDLQPTSHSHLGLSYAALDERKQWGRQDTYGGKLTENMVQAIARDCLAWKMQRLQALGFKIVLHVHDEVVVEVCQKEAPDALNTVCQVFAEPLPWAEELVLRGEGMISKYYCK